MDNITPTQKRRRGRPPKITPLSNKISTLITTSPNNISPADNSAAMVKIGAPDIFTPLMRVSPNKNCKNYNSPKNRKRRADSLLHLQKIKYQRITPTSTPKNLTSNPISHSNTSISNISITPNASNATAIHMLSSPIQNLNLPLTPNSFTYSPVDNNYKSPLLPALQFDLSVSKNLSKNLSKKKLISNKMSRDSPETNLEKTLMKKLEKKRDAEAEQLKVSQTKSTLSEEQEKPQDESRQKETVQESKPEQLKPEKQEAKIEANKTTFTNKNIKLMINEKGKAVISNFLPEVTIKSDEDMEALDKSRLASKSLPSLLSMTDSLERNRAISTPKSHSTTSIPVMKALQHNRGTRSQEPPSSPTPNQQLLSSPKLMTMSAINQTPKTPKSTFQNFLNLTPFGISSTPTINELSASNNNTITPNLNFLNQFNNFNAFTSNPFGSCSGCGLINCNGACSVNSSNTMTNNNSNNNNNSINGHTRNFSGSFSNIDFLNIFNTPTSSNYSTNVNYNITSNPIAQPSSIPQSMGSSATSSSSTFLTSAPTSSASTSTTLNFGFDFNANNATLMLPQMSQNQAASPLVPMQIGSQQQQSHMMMSGIGGSNSMSFKKNDVPVVGHLNLMSNGPTSDGFEICDARNALLKAISKK